MQNAADILTATKPQLSFRKDCKGKGFEYNELIKEAIVAVHSCSQEESQAVAKKEIKKIDDYEIQDIEYMEIISHWILPKLYYLEEKIKEVKGINISKFTKHKATFIEKIKNGLRSVDRLKIFYEAALKTELRNENQPKDHSTHSEKHEKHEKHDRNEKSAEKLDKQKKMPVKKKKKLSTSSSSSSSQEIYEARKKSRGRKHRKKSRQGRRPRRQP